MDRLQPTPERRDVDIEIGRAWRAHRRHLLDIGYRMLGNVAEAEDVVQDAFARLVRADLDEIDDVAGWLVVVVSRLCLDRLKWDRRHPRSADSSLGEGPAAHAVDPVDRVTLDDTVRIALSRVLERLSPAERTAFVLHDVFQYPFDAIAEIVGRKPAACRQLASRARRTIQTDTGPARFSVEPSEQRRVTEEFIAACSNGDLDRLLAVLDPDVDGDGDIGGSIGTRSAAGNATVARQLMRFVGPTSSTTLLSLPATSDDAGVAVLRGGRVVTFLTLSVRGGVIDHIHALADPVKLTPLSEALGM